MKKTDASQSRARRRMNPMTKSRRRLRSSAPRRADCAGRSLRRAQLALILVLLALVPVPAGAQDSAGSPRRSGFVLDRAIVRYVAPETGGSRSPRFIFERVLAFEA